MASATLLDIAKINGADKVVGLIEENLAAAPEAREFPARQIRGTSYPTVKRIGLPTVGFRTANAGIAASKSTFARQLVETYILSAAIEVDLAVASAHEDGAAAYEMIEADGVMRQALVELGNQIWYGVTTDASGFPGIKAATPFGGAMTVNSGGSTATSQSSVYAVRFGVKDCQIITGNNTTFELSQFRDQQLTDASLNKYAGRVADLTAWVGLQIGNAYSVGRLCNVGAEGETGDTLTDAKLQLLWDKFPEGFPPSAFFMSRRSRSQLQRSRTVTLFGQGTARPNQPNIAPIPTEYAGIPIFASDSILDTDAVES
jgi:hypothetical protein